MKFAELYTKNSFWNFGFFAPKRIQRTGHKSTYSTTDSGSFQRLENFVYTHKNKRAIKKNRRSEKGKLYFNSCFLT
jgi:hypothetical protein